jgi:hypothetical protein
MPEPFDIQNLHRHFTQAEITEIEGLIEAHPIVGKLMLCASLEGGFGMLETLAADIVENLHKQRPSTEDVDRMCKEAMEGWKKPD